MTTVGGKFTTEKRNLVTYVENEQYELLRRLATQNGRSVSAEAALAIKKHLAENEQLLQDILTEESWGNMADKLNSMRLLEQQKIDFVVREFPDTIHSADGVADHFGLPRAMVYKTLVVLPAK